MEPQAETTCANNTQLLCLAHCIRYWNSSTHLCKKSCSDPCSDSCSWICSPICLVFSLKTVEVSCGACSVPGVCMFSFRFSQEPSRLSSRKRTFQITDAALTIRSAALLPSGLGQPTHATATVHQQREPSVYRHASVQFTWLVAPSPNLYFRQFHVF